jgi:hypothetical protein
MKVLSISHSFGPTMQSGIDSSWKLNNCNYVLTDNLSCQPYNALGGSLCNNAPYTRGPFNTQPPPNIPSHLLLLLAKEQHEGAKPGNPREVIHIFLDLVTRVGIEHSEEDFKNRCKHGRFERRFA